MLNDKIAKYQLEIIYGKDSLVDDEPKNLEHAIQLTKRFVHNTIVTISSVISPEFEFCQLRITRSLEKTDVFEREFCYPRDVTWYSVGISLEWQVPATDTMGINALELILTSILFQLASITCSFVEVYSERRMAGNF